MQTVVLLPLFERDAKSAGLTDDDILDIAAVLARDPTAGDLMVGTGGARKLRHRSRSAGKSGGYRTIHYYGGADVPIFLIAIFKKGEKDNLSKAERNAVARLIPELVNAYTRKDNK